MNTDYIKLLASQSCTDISDWDMRIFNRTGNDKRKINKIFFEHKAKTASQELNISKDILKEVKKTKFSKDKIIKKLENSIIVNRDKVLKLSEKIDLINKTMVQTRQKINKLQNKNENNLLKEEIEKIVKEGFWENPIIQNNVLYFNTKNEVITYTNNVNFNIKKNFGKFAVAIDLSKLKICLLPYENNICTNFCNDCIHPFVMTGDICWGNALATLSKFKSQFELAKILTLLFNLLIVYDVNSNPYYDISCFGSREVLYNYFEDKHPKFKTT